MKLCIDCKWFDGCAHCLHERATSIDMVDGGISFMNCKIFRTTDCFRNECGLEGNLWEQRTYVNKVESKKGFLKRLFK